LFFEFFKIDFKVLAELDQSEAIKHPQIHPFKGFTTFKLGLFYKKKIILPLKRFELRGYEVMLNLEKVKLQLEFKPLRCNLTHCVVQTVKTSPCLRYCRLVLGKK